MAAITTSEKLATLQKMRLLILGAMRTLNPEDGDPADLDADLYGIWLELQAAWMSTQETICKIAAKGMEEGDGD